MTNAAPPVPETGDGTIPPDQTTRRDANRVLAMSTVDFTVMFAVWMCRSRC